MVNLSINKKLLPMKAHYFLFNAGTAPYVPFIPTLIKQLGFSSVIVGIVYTILPITSVLSKPLAGAFADRFQCQKAMFLSFIVTVILAYYAVPWIPTIPMESTAELHCSKTADVKMCSSVLRDDTCYINKITSQNRTIVCSMECEANATLLHEVCTSWGQHQFCSTSTPTGEHRLTALVSAHTGVNISTSTERNIVTSSPQTLRFKAEFLPAHSEKVEDCVLMPLRRVQFVAPNWAVGYCKEFAAAPCRLDCSDPLIDKISRTSKIPDSEVTSLYQFWLLLFCLVLSWVSMAIVVSVGDTICFSLLGSEPSKYGNQRLWGSVGWGIFSFFAGFLVDLFSSNKADKDYSPALYLMVVLLGLDILVSSKFKNIQTGKSPSIMRDLGIVLTNFKVCIFFLWCIFVGICTAFIWNFLFWYLEDLAGASQDCDTTKWIKTLEGLIMAIQCFIGELPFFFLSGWILKKLGHIHCMSLVLFAFGIRFLLYSSLTNPWWCLPIELMQGLTFGLFYATMTTYASVVAPKGVETTMQGLVGAIFEGVGVSIGSFIGGVMFKKMSGYMVFRSLGVVTIVAALLHSIVQYFIAKQAIPSSDNKDFSSAKYASPTDAVHMLSDNNELSPT